VIRWTLWLSLFSSAIGFVVVAAVTRTINGGSVLLAIVFIGAGVGLFKLDEASRARR
jgi:dipeptide/tripeptide permease